MSIGIQCLLTDDLDAARLLAGRLTQLNHDRRELELQMQHEAMLTVADMRPTIRRCRWDCACSTNPGIRASSVWWLRA